MLDFFESLEASCRRKDSLLCVGLDPVPAGDAERPGTAILDMNERIIEATKEYAAAYKPNIAFYEAFGADGYLALEKTIALIPDDIPVIIDAKRCDIGNTAQAYAKSLFDHFEADAVTLSPYMGRDAADPFLTYPGKGLFLLARTSNPSAKAIQDLVVGEGMEPLYLAVAKECVSWSDRIGLVAAGNDYPALSLLRRHLPETWFLVPGIGAQGGEAEKAVKAGIRADGLGLLAVVVRAICEAPDPAKAARECRDAMRRAVAASK
jgi:orotidine 5'-phosphate decarboxylase subfamily 2